jgi:hypothetical protein
MHELPPAPELCRDRPIGTFGGNLKAGTKARKAGEPSVVVKLFPPRYDNKEGRSPTLMKSKGAEQCL